MHVETLTRFPVAGEEENASEEIEEIEEVIIEEEEEEECFSDDGVVEPVPQTPQASSPALDTHEPVAATTQPAMQPTAHDEPPSHSEAAPNEVRLPAHADPEPVQLLPPCDPADSHAPMPTQETEPSQPASQFTENEIQLLRGTTLSLGDEWNAELEEVRKNRTVGPELETVPNATHLPASLETPTRWSGWEKYKVQWPKPAEATPSSSGIRCPDDDETQNHSDQDEPSTTKGTFKEPCTLMLCARARVVHYYDAYVHACTCVVMCCVCAPAPGSQAFNC